MEDATASKAEEDTGVKVNVKLENDSVVPRMIQLKAGYSVHAINIYPVSMTLRV